MTATDQRQDATVEPDRSWLDTEVDGRPVRSWIRIGLAIAVVTTRGLPTPTSPTCAPE